MKEPRVVTSKAQAIRDMATQLGKKSRPRHIIAALAEKGITVVSAQVSTVLKTAGMRRGRRRRKVAAIANRSAASNGKTLNFDELFLVKRLADQLGGTHRVKEALAVLERLA